MSTSGPVTKTDDQKTAHLTQIAQSLSQHTGVNTGIKDIQPVLEQHPLDEVSNAIIAQHAEEDPNLKVDKSELEDVMQGLQGRPRTTSAIGILQEKMKYLAKKTGSAMKLVEKKK